MKTTFKDFMGKQDRSEEHVIELIHHIAEEELVACKIISIKKTGDQFIIIADCHDRPRPKGIQDDLTIKLNKRLNHQKFADGSKVEIQVINK